MTRQISVGVAGLGTVGFSVARQLVERQGQLERRTDVDVRLEAVADPDPSGEKRDFLADCSVYDGAEEMLEESELDVLVELIGGVEPAGTIILNALKSGVDVVTANKELLAKRGEQIFARAAEGEGRLRFEAAVGGSIPIIRTIREGMVGVDFNSIFGIVNGTTNYVLTRMARDDMSFGNALELARDKGYAEADPTADIKGYDSAHKMTILTELAFGFPIPVDCVRTEGIESITPQIMEDAERLGYCIKLLGIAKKTDRGVDVRVHPTLIPDDSALAAVNNEYNAVYLQNEPAGSSMLYGRGAGGPSTATAVVSDIISLASCASNLTPTVHYSESDYGLISPEELTSRYYLRLNAVDRPGVLARVTRILGDHDISIDYVLQRAHSAGELVPVVLTTHEANEASVQRAVEDIADLQVIGKEPTLLRIEEDFDRE